MFLRSKKLYISLLLITWLQFTAAGQASFTATISPSSIGRNETAELRLLVDNAKQVDQITPPVLKDFIILSGPNQETGMESNNGVTRQYIGITYILKPRAPGRFTIGSAVAKADGKNLRSNSLQLGSHKKQFPERSKQREYRFGWLIPFPGPDDRTILQ
jgi:hypothetical protein